jgi:hypothetical protein
MIRLACILALALALTACGAGNTAAPADAAADAAVDAAPAEDAPQDDAAGWGTTGARVVTARMRRPIDIAGPGPEYEPHLASVTVLLARPVADGLEVRAGHVSFVVEDGGVGLGYEDDLTPVAVSAAPGEPYEGDGGARRPFTTEAATWRLLLSPGGPLTVHNAVIRGSLDDRGLPTSNDPPLGGTVTGCFTRDEAGQLYIPVLGITLLELITSSGGSVDVDCSGSGALDGFSFEMQFGGEPIELQDLPDLDGGQRNPDGG